MDFWNLYLRESRTKPFSKEGLQIQDKNGAQDSALTDLQEWITQCITQLDEQVYGYEQKLKQLTGKLKKNEKAEQEELTQRVDRHTFHIKTLEKIRIALERGAVSVDDVKALQDDISYYIEENEVSYSFGSLSLIFLFTIPVTRLH